MYTQTEGDDYVLLTVFVLHFIDNRLLFLPHIIIFTTPISEPEAMVAGGCENGSWWL